MKRETISYAMGNISTCHIEEAAMYERTKKTPIWIKSFSIAACVALIAGLGFLGRSVFPGTVTPAGNIIIRPSADDVGAVFAGSTDSAGISDYISFFYPEGKQLMVTPVPEDEHLSLYRIETPQKTVDSKELSAFSTNILSQLSAGLGVTDGAWVSSEYSTDSKLVQSHKVESGLLTVRFEQTEGKYSGELCADHVFITNGAEPISFNSKTIQINPSQSEEEILASLQWVKQALFEAFGHTFDSESVRIVYRGDRSPAVASVFVHYYDSDDLLGKQGITIRFLHSMTGEPEVLDQCDVTYTKYRLPAEQYCVEEGVAERISLASAEEMLSRGYVFGSHSCSACVSMQDRIDFTEYDRVGLEYIQGEQRMLPFYAFYKKIGTAENGNAIYAKTYVCAVEVDGLEDYFTRQAEHHAVSSEGSGIVVTTRREHDE